MQLPPRRGTNPQHSPREILNKTPARQTTRGSFQHFKKSPRLPTSNTRCWKGTQMKGKLCMWLESGRRAAACPRGSRSRSSAGLLRAPMNRTARPAFHFNTALSLRADACVRWEADLCPAKISLYNRALNITVTEFSSPCGIKRSILLGSVSEIFPY